ncbi:hypothetical protein M446_5372 [Methylobacterium sp. 4-46]|uniref:hypothetical protein n=1 Tax=unclassified Methylobacterium TaxID=2615210 RepID=UPI000165CC8F|nr:MULTISPECIES: hypothetical protein [Methylobacterium]ACA19690.1 hypothetical protein M446_5372 [Methylobacterium sp. 4-46]WFT78886.1 hypothetical protein QA634_27035 [Methylobacterium nodulans]
MTTLKTLALAAVLAAATAVPALAQGGSPYNNSGQQAGGPLAGRERSMGAPGGTPAMRMAPRQQRMMRHQRMHRRHHVR